MEFKQTFETFFFLVPVRKRKKLEKFGRWGGTNN